MATFHDQFCGAGGSTEGAVNAGAEPVLGINHSAVACETYEANHAQHGAQALCQDVVVMDPRSLPPADMLLTSPECTHHSYARGRQKDDPSLFDPTGDKEAERSRATMWDVPRFAEVHDYDSIIVENVEQAIKWGLRKGQKLGHGDYGPLFASWLNAMAALGYEHRCVHLNALVVGVPQSRDRLFVCFWKKGAGRPDLDIPALGYCFACEKLVESHQRWKRPGATSGLLGQQYVYSCVHCRETVALAIKPAATAIDWALPAPKIGERSKPLAPATMDRIRRGLEKLSSRPMVLPITHVDSSKRARDVAMPLPTLTAYQEQALVVQVGGHTFERPGYARAWQAAEPFKTIHTTLDRGVVVSNMAHNVPKLSESEPMGAVTGGNKLYLLDTMRNHSVPVEPHEGPVPTITAGGTHHALVIAHYGSEDGPAGKQGHQRDPDAEPLGTIKTRDSHSLLTYRGTEDVRPVSNPLSTVASHEQHALLEHDAPEVALEECGFRMLQPDELKVGQDFPADYDMRGNKRQQTNQIGNAVPAGAEHELVSRMVEAIS